MARTFNPHHRARFRNRLPRALRFRRRVDGRDIIHRDRTRRRNISSLDADRLVATKASGGDATPLGNFSHIFPTRRGGARSKANMDIELASMHGGPSTSTFRALPATAISPHGRSAAAPRAEGDCSLHAPTSKPPMIDDDLAEGRPTFWSFHASREPGRDPAQRPPAYRARGGQRKTRTSTRSCERSRKRAGYHHRSAARLYVCPSWLPCGDLAGGVSPPGTTLPVST